MASWMKVVITILAVNAIALLIGELTEWPVAQLKNIMYCGVIGFLWGVADRKNETTITVKKEEE